MSCNHAPSLPQMFRDSRQFAHVCECAISIVVKQPTGGGIVSAWDAVIAFARLSVPAEKVLLFAEVDELTHEQIQLPVVVIVKPNSARRPAGNLQSTFLSDVGEFPVAFVVVKDAAPVLRQEEVWKSIAIVVTHGDPHSVASAEQAGLFGHVGKGPVTIVPIKGVPQWGMGIVKIA